MRYENPRPVYPNELYHHGIMGQHWGETNGPPYPLGSGTHNRIVRQGRAERKENKRAFINARNAYEEKAFMYKDALAGAKKAERQAAKLERKASKNSAYSQQAKAARTNANAMNRRADFYKTGHDTFYKAYKEAAAKAGKKARYTGDDRFSITGRNINSASSKALTRGNNMGAYTGQAAYLASVLAGLSNPVTLGLTLGSGIAGRAYDIKGMSNRTKQLRAQERDIESRFAKQLSAAKSEYKTQRASGPRHTGSSAPKTTKQSGGTSAQRSATTEKNAIMKEMNRRFGNSERNKEALAELKAELKTTKGTYDKKGGVATYSTRFGLFDVYYGKNGNITNIAFND